MFSMITVCLLVAASVVEPETNAVEVASADVAAVSVPARGEMAKITSGTAYYDRKEGYAYFSDKVFVDDAAYKLHADRAYVYMDGTNALKRIVALGHVALTNGTKCAYGEKISYYRQPGLIVLTASDTTPAEVRDSTSDGDQVVRGKKIKFWTASQQVEVQEAWITAPTSGKAQDSFKNVLGR